MKVGKVTTLCLPSFVFSFALAHPASCAIGTRSFPAVRCGRGVRLTPQPLLVSRSKIE